MVGCCHENCMLPMETERSLVLLTSMIEGHISLLDGANMIKFMGRRNQIEFFVRFKADQSMECLHYDPYVYHVVYQ